MTNYKPYDPEDKQIYFLHNYTNDRVFHRHLAEQYSPDDKEKQAKVRGVISHVQKRLLAKGGEGGELEQKIEEYLDSRKFDIPKEDIIEIFIPEIEKYLRQKSEILECSQEYLEDYISYISEETEIEISEFTATKKEEAYQHIEENYEETPKGFGIRMGQAVIVERNISLLLQIV